MKYPQIKQIKKCRACNSKRLTKIISLGPTPNANSYLQKKQIDQPELYYPLDVLFCDNCNFLQLGHAIDPKVLFSDYVYVSATSPIFIQHFEKYADSISSDFKIDNKSLVVDIGSNDGTLLSYFKKNGAKVLGVEPVKKIAQSAKKNGIRTITDFFNLTVAGDIQRKYGNAKIICANNTFAQISDLDGLLSGVYKLLAEDGVFVVEVPYVVDMLKNGYFDLIYHEHHSLPSVHPLVILFRRHNMEIFDVKKFPVHGGTIRVFVKKKKGPYDINSRVNEFVSLEKKMGLHNTKVYITFFNKVQKNKIALLNILSNLKSKNYHIAGYGAAAKSNTLLNFYNIGTETLEYIVDDSGWKQGLYTPGKRILIENPQKLYQNPVDYILILAWNFADSIMEKHKKFKVEHNGKFIIPFPTPRII